MDPFALGVSCGFMARPLSALLRSSGDEPSKAVDAGVIAVFVAAGLVPARLAQGYGVPFINASEAGVQACGPIGSVAAGFAALSQGSVKLVLKPPQKAPTNRGFSLWALRISQARWSGLLDGEARVGAI